MLVLTEIDPRVDNLEFQQQLLDKEEHQAELEQQPLEISTLEQPQLALHEQKIAFSLSLAMLLASMASLWKNARSVTMAAQSQSHQTVVLTACCAAPIIASAAVPPAARTFLPASVARKLAVATISTTEAVALRSLSFGMIMGPGCGGGSSCCAAHDAGKIINELNRIASFMVD
jgi:hypothetical protein